MLRAKPEPAPSPAATEVLTEILRLRTQLIERDRELLPKEIALWQSGAQDEDEIPEDDAAKLTRSLLNGFAAPALASATPGAEIKQIRTERRAISRALDQLQQKEVVASGAALVEVMQQFGTDWLRIQRRRHAAMVEVRDAEAEAEAFRQAVSARCGGRQPALVGDRGNQPALTRHAMETLAAIVAAGLVT